MGTEAQKARILRPLAASEFVAATAALMEPRWDFGLTDLQTTAKRDGANWILSGAKCGVPIAAESETILVYAKSGAGEGFAGVEAFILPRTAAGVISRRTRDRAWASRRSRPMSSSSKM